MVSIKYHNVCFFCGYKLRAVSLVMLPSDHCGWSLIMLPSDERGISVISLSWTRDVCVRACVRAVSISDILYSHCHSVN